MQRAVLRETAVRSIDALTEDLHLNLNLDLDLGLSSPRAPVPGSLMAHMPAVSGGVLNETSVNALIQVRNNKLNYALIYDSQ